MAKLSSTEIFGDLKINGTDVTIGGNLATHEGNFTSVLSDLTTIALTGDVTGSGTFDIDGDLSFATTASTCTLAADSTLFTGKALFTANTGSVSIPSIGGNNGVMEVGRYIDFHTSGSTVDYDIRFDCTSANNININGGSLTVSNGVIADLTGNASTATKLAASKTIDITGDITATAVAFDGSDNVAISASVNNDSHTHNTQYMQSQNSRVNDQDLNLLIGSTKAYKLGSGTLNDPEAGDYGSLMNFNNHDTNQQLLFTHGADSGGADIWFRTDSGSGMNAPWRRVYHDSNIPTWNQSTTGNAATATWADKVDVNTSTSTSNYGILWNSGDTVYTAGSSKLSIQPSTGKVICASTMSATSLISTVATGTAPLTVTSTTKVTNLNADLLDGYHANSASTASTIALRDSSGDINARLFRSEYDGTNASVNYIMTQIDTTSNNYIRPSTPAQFRAGVTDAYYLRPATHSNLTAGFSCTALALTDATTVAVNLTLRNIFTLAIGASRNIS